MELKTKEQLEGFLVNRIKDIRDIEEILPEGFMKDVRDFEEYLHSEEKFLSKDEFVKKGRNYYYYKIFYETDPEVLEFLYKNSKTSSDYKKKVKQIKKVLSSLLEQLYYLIDKYGWKDKNFIDYEVYRFVEFFVYKNFLVKKFKDIDIVEYNIFWEFLEKYFSIRAKKIYISKEEKIKSNLYLDTIRWFIFNIFLTREYLTLDRLKGLLEDLTRITYLGNYKLNIIEKKVKCNLEDIDDVDYYFTFDIAGKYLSQNKQKYFKRILNLVLENLELIYKNKDKIKKVLRDRLEYVVDLLINYGDKIEILDEELLDFILLKLEKHYFESKLSELEDKELIEAFFDRYEIELKDEGYKRILKDFINIYSNLPKDLRKVILMKGLVEFFVNNKDIFSVLSVDVIRLFLENKVNFEEIEILFNRFGEKLVNEVILKYLQVKEEFSIGLDKFISIYDNINQYQIFWNQIKRFQQILEEAIYLGYNDVEFISNLKIELNNLQKEDDLKRLENQIRNIEEKISRSGIKEFIQKRRKFYDVYKGEDFKKDFVFVSKFLDKIRFPKKELENIIKKLLSLENISDIVKNLERLNLQEILKNKSEEEKLKFMDNLQYLFALDLDDIVKRQGKKKLVDIIIHYDFDQYSEDIFDKMNKKLGEVLTRQDFYEIKRKFNIYCKNQDNIEDLYVCKKVLLDEFYYLVKKIVKYGGEELGLELVSVILELSEDLDLRQVMDKIDLTMDILFRFKDVIRLKKLKIDDILDIDDEVLLNVVYNLLFVKSDIEEKLKEKMKDKKIENYTLSVVIDRLNSFIIEEIDRNEVQTKSNGDLHITNKQIQKALGDILDGKK